MFTNLKIRTRLICSFLLVALIAFLIGVFGYFKVHQLKDSDRFSRDCDSASTAPNATQASRHAGGLDPPHGLALFEWEFSIPARGR